MLIAGVESVRARTVDTPRLHANVDKPEVTADHRTPCTDGVGHTSIKNSSQAA